MSNTAGLDLAYEEVRIFHKTFGHPAPDAPGVPQTLKARTDRSNFIRSECDELEVAETVQDQVDAYLDIIYFALGGLVELSVRPWKAFLAVQAANMRKLWPDGKPRYREGDNKVLKPEGWYGPEPEIEAEVNRQIAQAREVAAA